MREITIIKMIDMIASGNPERSAVLYVNEVGAVSIEEALERHGDSEHLDIVYYGGGKFLLDTDKSIMEEIMSVPNRVSGGISYADISESIPEDDIIVEYASGYDRNIKISYVLCYDWELGKISERYKGYMVMIYVLETPSDVRICSHCGKPMHDGMMDDEGLYLHEDCLEEYMNKTYGKHKWMQSDSENEEGGYYLYIDEGKIYPLGLFYTTWWDDVPKTTALFRELARQIARYQENTDDASGVWRAMDDLADELGIDRGGEDE